jgi:hypothetical protein
MLPFNIESMLEEKKGIPIGEPSTHILEFIKLAYLPWAVGLCF